MAIDTSDSASSSQANPFIRQSVSPFSASLSSAISVKLDKENYLIWRSQIFPAIRGHNLQGLVLGTKTCPPEFLTVVDEAGKSKAIPNPEYENWNREDQLLLSWLLSTLTTSNLRSVTRIGTSRGLWAALEKLFAVKSKARLIPLRVQLQTTRKAICRSRIILQKWKA